MERVDRRVHGRRPSADVLEEVEVIGLGIPRTEASPVNQVGEPRDVVHVLSAKLAVRHLLGCASRRGDLDVDLSRRRPQTARVVNVDNAGAGRRHGRRADRVPVGDPARRDDVIDRSTLTVLDELIQARVKERVGAIVVVPSPVGARKVDAEGRQGETSWVVEDALEPDRPAWYWRQGPKRVADSIQVDVVKAVEVGRVRPVDAFDQVVVSVTYAEDLEQRGDNVNAAQSPGELARRVPSDAVVESDGDRRVGAVTLAMRVSQPDQNGGVSRRRVWQVRPLDE